MQAVRTGSKIEAKARLDRLQGEDNRNGPAISSRPARTPWHSCRGWRPSPPPTGLARGGRGPRLVRWGLGLGPGRADRPGHAAAGGGGSGVPAQVLSERRWDVARPRGAGGAQLAATHEAKSRCRGPAQRGGPWTRGGDRGARRERPGRPGGRGSAGQATRAAALGSTWGEWAAAECRGRQGEARRGKARGPESASRAWDRGGGAGGGIGHLGARHAARRATCCPGRRVGTGDASG